MIEKFIKRIVGVINLKGKLVKVQRGPATVKEESYAKATVEIWEGVYGDDA